MRVVPRPPEGSDVTNGRGYPLKSLYVIEKLNALLLNSSNAQFLGAKIAHLEMFEISHGFQSYKYVSMKISDFEIIGSKLV